MTDLQWVASFVAILTGLGALLVSVLRLHNGIAQQFDQTRRESEERAIGTHARIDLLGRTIDQTYLRKDVHEAHIKRLDGEIANIKGSLGCPATGKGLTMSDDTDFIAALAAELRTEEGFRTKPYRDQYGNLTIGYGRNLDDHGIGEAEAAILLANDIATAADLCRTRFAWYGGLSAARRRAVADMAFNMGLPRLLGFHQMLGAFAAGDFAEAADQAEASMWFHQVGERGTRIVGLIRQG